MISRIDFCNMPPTGGIKSKIKRIPDIQPSSRLPLHSALLRTRQIQVQNNSFITNAALWLDYMNCNWIPVFIPLSCCLIWFFLYSIYLFVLSMNFIVSLFWSWNLQIESFRSCEKSFFICLFNCIFICLFLNLDSFVDFKDCS